MADNPFEINFEFRTERFQSAAEGLKAFGDRVMTAWKDIAPGVLRKELEAYLRMVAEALAKRHGNPWPSGTTDNSLSRRTGHLIDSIRQSVAVYGSSLDDIYGTLGSDMPYARIHEFGGTIRAVSAQYLTIPLPAALNGDGTPKQRSARDWGNTFVFRSRAGSLIIAQKNGIEITPLYVLKKEVYIKPRLHMADSLRAGVPYFVDRAMEAMVNAVRDGLS